MDGPNGRKREDAMSHDTARPVPGASHGTGPATWGGIQGHGAVHRAQLLFNFSLRDPDGGYRRLEARPLEFSVPAEKLAGAQGQSIAYKIELKLEPGAYQLAVAVADKIAGATSATTTGFNVAKPR